MAKSDPSRALPVPRAHFEPLRWIGAYKLLKAILALVAGLLALRLMHRDLPAIAVRVMEWLQIDPDSRAGRYLLRHVLQIRAQGIGWVATLLLVYVPLFAAQGIGLIMRKVWAEWLTVFTTGVLIPVEAYWVVRRRHVLSAVVLVLNILVVTYLIVRIHRDRQRRRGLPAAPSN